MSSQNSLTCRLAFLGEGDQERETLEKLRAQLNVPGSLVFSTKELRAYRSFACDYCVLSPATASAEAVRALIAQAGESPSDPQLILLLLRQHTARLEEQFAGMCKPPQIIRMEDPNIPRAAELINSFFILEGQIGPPEAGWEFVGATAPVHKLYDSIRSFARWDKDAVLITGETGTGKELVARRLHKLRGVGNFRPYNAAAIPLNLAASELFGHVKGAFTDARKDSKGYIIAAADGTLFIDEIGETELALQVMLLRVLQERRVIPLGEDESHARETEARFVFATNRNLEEACRVGKFREDLFHRISVLQIEVKPLRERMADIPLLVRYFVQEFVKDYESVAAGLGTDNVLKLGVLFDYDWPGNVRELRNVVRQAATLTRPGEAIDHKLAELVGKKKRKADAGKSASLPSNVNRELEQLGSLVRTLLKSDWLTALRRFRQAYDLAQYQRAKGSAREIVAHSGFQKTTAHTIKNRMENSFFTEADVQDARGLAAKLKEGADTVSEHIRGRLTNQARQSLNAYHGGDVCAKLLGELVDELNRRLQEFDLYQPDRFRLVVLSPGTQSLLSEDGLVSDLFRLNRMLIEDAFPDEIKKGSAPVEPEVPYEDAD